ncbi:uncharacterized protein PpBr36_10046 [Pyricularia pennisetigena]|uniref:uncharacterized protein n=1 Tax=Pyricularia pennisetigena TaxID=1578925 RepID=UPI0011548234|nr:uncharacterized protein PpBr36_10046 [Pyricularia pennisetigena]TLS22477.1 hypothetical protein PpBr36_10046 [Pyricularia pennisetigena]
MFRNSPVKRLARQAGRLAGKARRIVCNLCGSCKRDDSCTSSQPDLGNRRRRRGSLASPADYPIPEMKQKSDLGFTAMEFYPRHELVRRRDRPIIITTASRTTSVPERTTNQSSRNGVRYDGRAT